MYCPTCGSEERQPSQFCRACGTDMRAVRITLERPDAVTESAISAREQIGRAVADKIRTTKSAGQLKKVAEEVLPEIEKFLESPAERRLRRLRNGMIMTFIGIGAALGGVLASLVEQDLFVMIIPGMIMLFIGLGVMLNGLLFTIPRKQLTDHPLSFSEQKGLDSQTFTAHRSPVQVLEAPTNELEPGPGALPSVTEHTTHHLKVQS